MPPEEVVRRAQAEGACVTFTYSEPIVFLEYCIDTAVAAHKLGVRTTMVTGGSGEVEPMKEACKVLDAVKVDLKGFTEDYYQQLCKGKLAPVLKTIETDARERSLAGTGAPVYSRAQRQRARNPRHVPLGEGPTWARMCPCTSRAFPRSTR